MINVNAIMSSLITHLKADNDLVVWLTARNSQDEIRERDWQGRSFVYPGVRVAVGTQTPTDDGVCHFDASDIPFQVYCFSEQDSSYECAELDKLVYNALAGKHLAISGSTTSLMTCDSLSSPIRTPVRIWQTTTGYRLMQR